VINNYKGVMLCSRPNEKKAVDYEKYLLTYPDPSAAELCQENSWASTQSKKTMPRLTSQQVTPPIFRQANHGFRKTQEVAA
jgi:hypothetical protein